MAKTVNDYNESDRTGQKGNWIHTLHTHIHTYTAVVYTTYYEYTYSRYFWSYLKINIFTSTHGTHKFSMKHFSRLVELVLRPVFLRDMAAMLSPISNYNIFSSFVLPCSVYIYLSICFWCVYSTTYIPHTQGFLISFPILWLMFIYVSIPCSTTMYCNPVLKWECYAFWGGNTFDGLTFSMGDTSIMLKYYYLGLRDIRISIPPAVFSGQIRMAEVDC